jgi:hypothetical protein
LWVCGEREIARVIFFTLDTTTMGKTSRITRIGIPKQKKEQLKLQKQSLVQKATKPKPQKQKQEPIQKKKYVTEGMTDYLKLMKM